MLVPAGLLACQFVLLGSSLWGKTILLPLDILAGPDIYLPRPSVSVPWPEPKDVLRSDLVYQTEVWRRFVVEEVRAGRLPLWNPHNYCGHPLLAADQGQVFSPYRLLDYVWPSPVSVAWSAVLRALVGGIGMCLFFRRAAGVTWLAAAMAAWAFPLTGTMVLSGGYAGAAVVSFLPWVLLAADAVARRPGKSTVAALAVATACTLLAGHTAYAGQVLLAAGAFFLVRLAGNYFAPPHAGSFGPGFQPLARVMNPPRCVAGFRPAARRRLFFTTLAGAAGVGLGLLLSAPQTLPLVDYLRSSLRVAQRARAAEDTPAGPPALVQLVVPYAFGSSQRGSDYIGGFGENRIESAAGGYAGLILVIVFAPLGWADPRRRRQLIFCAAVFVLAMSPTVGIPLLRLLFRIPPVSLLRSNRLVFVAGFALLAAGAIGLDAWVREPGLFGRPAGRRCVGSGLALATALGVSLAARAAQSNPAAPGGIPWRAIASHPAALLWPDAWGLGRHDRQ